jgi:hypothetical protein
MPMRHGSPTWINGQQADTPDQGAVGIPYLDGYVE